MKEPDFFDSLVIVGDEGWTRKEWEAHIRQRSPEHKERRRGYNREYRRRNRERINRVNREWMARYRSLRAAPRLVGSLHSMSCTGPIKATGCRCHKIRCYSKPPRPSLLRRSDVEPA